MSISYEAIIEFLKTTHYKFEFNGDSKGEIKGFCTAKSPKNECILWIKNSNQFPVQELSKLQNILIVTAKELSVRNDISYLLTENPKEVFFEVLNHFFVSERSNRIEKTSVVESEKVGNNISIGHFCYIGPQVDIGNNVIIEHNVMIYNKVKIGSNSIIHSGSVIGTDGYGFYSRGDEKHIKEIHFGGIDIGRNVEIGANVCISRGTIDNTIIDDGVKIDNLSHIAHNVHIEENVYISANVIICGSAVISKNAYLSPNCIVNSQIKIGRNSFVSMGAIVNQNLKENKAAIGCPKKTIVDKELLGVDM